MKCVICKEGDTKLGTTTVLLERDHITMVVKDVPAEVCQNCQEAYVDEATTRQLLEDAERLAKSGTQVDIRQYASA